MLVKELISKLQGIKSFSSLSQVVVLEIKAKEVFEIDSVDVWEEGINLIIRRESSSNIQKKLDETEVSNLLNVESKIENNLNHIFTPCIKINAYLFTYQEEK